jgi:hypothetical protein
MINKTFFFHLLFFAVFISQAFGQLKPGDPDWPVVWTSYGEPVKSLEEDLQDMLDHGVQCVSMNARDALDARYKLQLARKLGIKYDIRIGSHLTVNAVDIKQAGLKPEPAIMLGGVYQGKAIDRHVYAFGPERQKIIIEPPVYNQKFAYTGRNSGEPAGHYFAEIGDPLRAEIVVPLKEFDGKQHLKVIPATIRNISGPIKLDDDSVTDDMPDSYETRDRTLYELSFDLTGMEDALLEKVGIAVYWVYQGSEEWYMFSAPPATQCHVNSHKAVREIVKDKLKPWMEANDGTFPEDVIVAGRFGDECFYITGHLREHTPSVNYPLWDFSATALKDFKNAAGDIEPPRTWGFPEIYGEDAYAWFLYQFHKSCAGIVSTVKDEVDKMAPNLLVYRNTARDGVFTMQNDHDGSGPELLTREFDFVHLDPYPVTVNGYLPLIPRDMSYYAGLARRYLKPLIPWMQAHSYVPTGLVHVNAEEVERMMEEQMHQGVDAIKWLGYSRGQTFPNQRPEAWEKAGELHHGLLKKMPSKPEVKMAVIRSYKSWAVSSQLDGQIRNPADWLMQQLLEVWAVKYGYAYDVFEVPPGLSSDEKQKLYEDLKKYPYLVSNIPWEKAWVVGENTQGQLIPKTEAGYYQDEFEKQLKEKKWLK